MAGISSSALDQVQLEQYLLKRKLDRPNFASVPVEQLYELTGLQKEGQFTLTAVLLFSLYPQAYFPPAQHHRVPCAGHRNGGSG